MSGGGAQPQVTGTTFNPAQQSQLNDWFSKVSSAGNGATAGVNQAAAQSPGAPTLNSNFSQFFNPNNGYTSNFNNMGGLDARGQALVSQQQGQAAGSVAAQSRANQSQLGAGNRGLANVLNRQAGTQALLGGQSAFASAANDQQGRALATNQSQLQSAEAQGNLQQAGNNTRLDQFDAGQAAAAQKANLAALSAQIPQSTLASLFGTAQGLGQQYAQVPGSTDKSAAGIAGIGRRDFNGNPIR